MPTQLSTGDLLERLVAFDSTSRNSNTPIAEFICDYVDRPGVRIDKHNSPAGDKVNLIISTGPQENPDRAGLILSGHMDAVAAEEEDWSSDPFELMSRQGSYFGRGACDMKGFLALAMNIIVRSSETPLAHPLVLVFTYDEEVGTIGAERLIKSWPDVASLPRLAVIGEPTSLRAVRMHKGHLKLLLTFTGRAAHSGYPHLGSNAIEPAGKAIVQLTELRDELATEHPPHSEHFGEVPYPTLNIGRVIGGSAVNIVPDRCTVEVGIRTLPEMSSGELIERVGACLSGALQEANMTLEMTGESPPMLLSENSELYRSLCHQIGQSSTKSVSFATDAGWFQVAGIESLLFGPGDMEQAHRANESIPIDQLHRAEPILERLTNRFCRAAY